MEREQTEKTWNPKPGSTPGRRGGNRHMHRLIRAGRILPAPWTILPVSWITTPSHFRPQEDETRRADRVDCTSHSYQNGYPPGLVAATAQEPCGVSTRPAIQGNSTLYITTRGLDKRQMEPRHSHWRSIVREDDREQQSLRPPIKPSRQPQMSSKSLPG